MVLRRAMAWELRSTLSWRARRRSLSKCLGPLEGQPLRRAGGPLVGRVSEVLIQQGLRDAELEGQMPRGTGGPLAQHVSEALSRKGIGKDTSEDHLLMGQSGPLTSTCPKSLGGKGLGRTRQRAKCPGGQVGPLTLSRPGGRLPPDRNGVDSGPRATACGQRRPTKVGTTYRLRGVYVVPTLVGAV